MAARSLECIARGEQILSIRTRQRVRRIFPRSSSHPEHAAHASDLPRCIPARRQLDWSVARASLIDALHLSVGPKLALGGPLGFGSAPGRFGYLRVALRTRLSGLFARFGRVSERCRVLDAECVCVDRVLMCLRGHRNASRNASRMVRSCAQTGQAAFYYQYHHVGHVGGVRGTRAEFVLRFCKNLEIQPKMCTVLRGITSIARITSTGNTGNTDHTYSTCACVNNNNNNNRYGR